MRGADRVTHPWWWWGGGGGGVDRITKKQYQGTSTTLQKLYWYILMMS